MVKAWLGAVLLVGAALPAAAQDGGVADPVLAAEQARIAAIEKGTRASVSVFAAGGRGGGSGVVISADGYALTNFHVVKPAGNFMQCSMPDDVLYDAVIVGIDPVGDVALIKLLGRDDFPHAEMGNSDDVQPGDWCFAVGNPFLLATDFQPTVTWGIVSGTHRYQPPAGTLLEYADCIQTDASINPGNSGGPLFNAQGQLIGINGRGSFEKRGRVNVGVGYAISINQIKKFMGYLKSGRIVDHATLGAAVSTSEDGRVLVSNILDSSDAWRRGLRYGDEIIEFGGRRVDSANSFKNVLGIYPKGWRVPLSFRKEDGQRIDTYVRLTGVHDPFDLIEKVQGKQDGSDGKPPEEPKEEPPPKEEDPEGEQQEPQPIQIPAGAAPRPELAKLYNARRGYANYHFNELNRDRVWKALLAVGDFTEDGAQGDWTLHGHTGDERVDITLGDQEVKGDFPSGIFTIDPAQDLDAQLHPPTSGGLLSALYLWRRFLRVGPKQFGDVYYLGTAPLPGEGGLFDVLVATHKTVDVRLFFDPGSGELRMVEFWPGDDRDPCEVYLSDYQGDEGAKTPRRVHVRYGDRDVGVIDVDEVKVTGE